MVGDLLYRPDLQMLRFIQPDWMQEKNFLPTYPDWFIGTKDFKRIACSFDVTVQIKADPGAANQVD
jgi:hypothetical protein